MRPAVFPAETFLHFAGPEMNCVTRIVRLEDIVVAVAVEIHKAQAVVAALFVEDCAAFGQRVAGGFPFLLLVIKLVDVAVDEQLARTVAIEIAEADAAVLAVFRQLHDADDSAHEIRVHPPFFAAPRPRAFPS